MVTALEFVFTPSPLIQETLLIDALWDFTGDPVVKTACSQDGDLNLIIGHGTKIPHALHGVGIENVRDRYKGREKIEFIYEKEENPAICNNKNEP